MSTAPGAPAKPEDPTEALETAEQPEIGGEREPEPQQPEATPEAAPAAPEPTTDAGGKPQAPQGERSEETVQAKDAKKPEPKPGPLKSAIERLTKPKADAAKPEGDKPAGEQPPKPAKPEAPKPEAAKPAGEPAPAQDEIFKDWSKSERDNTKGTVKQRFREMHKQLAETQAKAKEYEEPARVGQLWDSLIDRHQLRDVIADEDLGDDDIAWGLRANHAAIKAMQALRGGSMPADQHLKTVEEVHAGTVAILKAAGRLPAGAALEPLQGDLPQDLRELVDLGMTEADARLLAAARAAQGAAQTRTRQQQEQAARAKAAADAEKALRPSRSEQPPAQRREAPAQPWSQVELQRSRMQTLADIGAALQLDVTTEAGLAQVSQWAAKVLDPIVTGLLRKQLPGVDPNAAFQQLSPIGRRDLIREALEVHRQAQAARSTPPPAPSTTASRPLRTTVATPSPAKPQSQTAAAIARLTGRPA